MTRNGCTCEKGPKAKKKELKKISKTHKNSDNRNMLLTYLNSYLHEHIYWLHFVFRVYYVANPPVVVIVSLAHVILLVVDEHVDPLLFHQPAIIRTASQ